MAEIALLWHRAGDFRGRALFQRMLAGRPGIGGATPLHLPGIALASQAAIAQARSSGSGEARFFLLFDGRLDNRRELAAALGVEARCLDDAGLVLLALRLWDAGAFERLLGPFALAFFDAERRRLLLGRDPLGNRGLHYAKVAGQLAAATEIETLLAHPAVSCRIHEPAMLGYFAEGSPPEGRTFHEDVQELPPGCCLVATAEETLVSRYWKPEVGPRLRYARDEEYAEHFREVLSSAVQCRLPENAPAAVLMSGGLDSTSVAALAARAPGRPEGERLTAISWIFGSTPGADERRWISPTVDHLDLDPVWIRGDDAWPLQRGRAYRNGAGAPFQHAYPLLLDRAYRSARERGIGVLLTGDFGDHLYAGAAHWLEDLLGQGRFGDAWKGWLTEGSGGRGGGVLGRRAALARALRLPRRSSRPPGWLLPEARRRWERMRPAPEGSMGARVAWARMLDPGGTRALLRETFWAARSGVEIRRPYRDRRLVELVLSLPAHQLYRPGWLKWVLRKAMRGLLPESVRLRRQATSVMPLFARGLLRHERGRAGDLLGAGAQAWTRYLRRDWVESVYPARLEAGEDGLELAVLWRCLCAEQWWRTAEAHARAEAHNDGFDSKMFFMKGSPHERCA